MLNEEDDIQPEEINVFRISAAFTTAGQLKISTSATNGNGLTTPFADNDPRKAEEKKRVEQQELDRIRELAWLDARASEEDIAAVNGKLDKAIRLAAQREEELRNKLDQARQNAPKIDGRAVFPDGKGNFFFEDGKQVAASQAAAIDMDDYPEAIPVQEFDSNCEDYKSAADWLVELQASKAGLGDDPTNRDLRDADKIAQDFMDQNPALADSTNESDSTVPIAASPSGLSALPLTTSFAEASNNAIKPDKPSPKSIAPGNDIASLPDNFPSL